MPSGFDIAAEFRAGQSAQRGASLRHRLQHAVARVQAQWHGGTPTWSDWRTRLRMLDAAMPPSFVAAMRVAHGGNRTHVVTSAAVDLHNDQRAVWLAPRLPMTLVQVRSLWRGIAAQYQIPIALADAVPFTLTASHGQCRVLVPGRSVDVRLRSGASAAAWHDCLHELGHALVALCTVADVPRAVDETVAEVIAAQLVRAPAVAGGEMLSAFSDLKQVAQQMRQHRGALAQRLANAEATGHPTAAAQPPWALWHDPGAQAAYVAASHLAAPLLENGFADRSTLVQFVEQATRVVDVTIAALPGAPW